MIIELNNIKETHWFKVGLVYVDRKHIISMQERKDGLDGVCWDIRLTSGAQLFISIEQFLQLDLMNTAGT
jgi:hypothetical protein